MFKQDFTEGGGTIAAEVTYNPKQSSYRSEIQQVLGKNPKMEKVVIRWPSGKEQTLNAPQIGQSHRIKEPA